LQSAPRWARKRTSIRAGQRAAPQNASRVRAAFICRCGAADLWGATLTLGGKVQLVTSSSQPLLVVAPISGDTPIGTQPVVVSNAADASAPASVEVLARLKIDSANSASLVKTHVQSRAEFRERLTRALHYRWAHCQQRQQLRGERDPDHLHADRGRFLHGQREPTRGRYLRQPRRVGGVGFVGSN